MRPASHHAALNEEAIRQRFMKASDIKVMKIALPQKNGEPVAVLLVFCEGLCDSAGVNQFIIPNLKRMAERHALTDPAELETYVPFHWVSFSADEAESRLSAHVLAGDLVLCFESLSRAYAVQLALPPKREPEEPNTEVSVRGPRDGFTEEAYMNVALIRKRLRTDKLAVETYTLGNRTATKVNLLYLQDVIQENVLQGIQTRLHRIQVNEMVGTVQLEELLAGFSLLPRFSYTGRPDFAAGALLNGRFVLIAEGSPTAIMAPVSLSFLLNTSEDAHTFNLFVLFTRVMRIFGLLISVFLPGFFISLVSFHQDQLPFTLLATLVNARQGVPLPAPLEALVMLLLFEIFREAGMRLPSAFGQTLSVVGGLIIGQAAISAGIAAPGTIVVNAIAVLSTFTLVNQSLIGEVSLVRVFVLLAGGALGLFGVLTCLLLFVLYMVNIRSFGTYYLAPFSPQRFRDMPKIVLRMPWGKKN